MSESIKLAILFEDQDLLAINKPAGIVVNDATTVVGQTVQAWFRNLLIKQSELLESKNWQELVPENFDDSYGSPAEIFEQRSGIVHRLDKDTSGVLLLAKNPGSLVALLAQFRQRQVQKEYHCLVHGQMKLEQGVIDAPLGRASKDRKKFAVVPTGRSAQTEFTVTALYQGLQPGLILPGLAEKRSLYQDGFTLLRCWPKTGRTHQIRVHCAYIKHPLVGDKIYVGKKRAKLDPLWCPRQFLHAAELRFHHPRTKQATVITAPLAVDLVQVLLLLESSQ